MNLTSKISGSTAISSSSIHHLPHESSYILKPALRGLAKRMVYRLMNYKILDGFTDNEIFCILDAMYDLLKPAPAFIRIPAPVIIFGDTHGQFTDLLRIIDKVGTPPKSRYLFLGDYCDRGRKSIEILMLLFCLKLQNPSHVQILRGNHECTKMNRLYGFYEECRRARGTQMWKKFQKVFNELPLCCLVADRIITMHGGISPDIKGMETLYKLKKPHTHAECDTGVALDLMWSDPAAGADSCCSWQFNKMRNASWMFGTESVKDFCRLLNIDMIVRAHEVCRNGHMFYCDKLLCTVFSAPNYCGTDGNCASVMKVSEDLKYSFITFKPKLDKNSLSKEKLAELEKQSKNADVKSPNPTLHKTVLPDRTHEVHEKAKTSPPQTTAMQTTQTTTIISPSSSLSSISSEPNTKRSTATPPTATLIPTPTTKSTSDNSVTAVTTPTTSTGSIT
uniref:Serine/threonine-protein phosphatase n=1 Tax=Panagrolaimus sp. ES5 TaxID=591445 RepID=A0AC34GNS7_9BILA